MEGGVGTREEVGGDWMRFEEVGGCCRRLEKVGRGKNMLEEVLEEVLEEELEEEEVRIGGWRRC